MLLILGYKGIHHALSDLDKNFELSYIFSLGILDLVSARNGTSSEIIITASIYNRGWT